MRRTIFLAICLLASVAALVWSNVSRAEVAKREHDQVTRRRWIAFLVSKIDSRREDFGQEVRQSKWNDVGLLLEVCSYGPKEVIAAYQAPDDVWRACFGTGGLSLGSGLLTYRLAGLGDLFSMVEVVMCAVPHQPVTKLTDFGEGKKVPVRFGPQMWPLSIKAGQIVFVGWWPSSRTGAWPTAFPRSGSDYPNRYERDVKEYGLRDLSKFASQRLTPAERTALWQEFQTIQFTAYSSGKAEGSAIG